MDGRLFFIAVLPDESIQAEVTAFKLYAARHFRSSGALRSPPHITLFPPFSWAPEKLELLDSCLRGFAGLEKPFLQELRNFNCFQPRVIFVDVAHNEALWGLQARLEECLKTELGLETDNSREFHPHVTVAFKDLKRQVFPEAWAHFSGIAFERQFEVRDISLLEHNGRQWEVAGRYGLEGKGG